MHPGREAEEIIRKYAMLDIGIPWEVIHKNEPDSYDATYIDKFVILKEEISRYEKEEIEKNKK